MDKAVLVNNDIEVGSEVLQALDAAKLKISVATWLQLPEYEDWRLVLASRTFDRTGSLRGYGLIRKALDAAGFPIERKPTVLILRMDHPVIRDLRRIFAKAKSVEGMRIGGQTIGDRFIEYGYVYRIS